MASNRRVLCVEFELDPSRNSLKFKQALRERGFVLVERTDSQMKDETDKDFCLIVQFGLNPVPNHKRGLYFLDYLHERIPGVRIICVTGHHSLGIIMDIESREATYFFRLSPAEELTRKVVELAGEPKTAVS